MLDNRYVSGAAEAVISIVDEDRKGRRKIGPPEGFYTLEGAVEAVLFRHLDRPFERALWQAVEQVRQEEIGMRLGYIDPRDLADYDPDKPENMPKSRAEKLENLLTDALRELATLQEHRCNFNSQDYCTVCGLDGRA